MGEPQERSNQDSAGRFCKHEKERLQAITEMETLEQRERVATGRMGRRLQAGVKAMSGTIGAQRDIKLLGIPQKVLNLDMGWKTERIRDR